MVTLDFTVIDLDFPVGSKNKTATLVTGESEALLVDAGFTRADGHRLVAEVLDSGKTLTTVFISHADPDFYFGAEVIADAFPDATFVATPLVIEHIQHSYEGKLKAWAAPRREPAHPPGRHHPADRRPHPRGPPVRAQGRRRRAARPALPVAGRAPRDPRRRPAVPAGARLGRRHRHAPSSAPPGSPCSTRWPPSTRSSSSPGHRLPGTADRPERHHRHPRLPARLRGGTGQGRRRRRADRGPGAPLPGRRHADRRPARRQGRQGRDDLGLTAMTDLPTRCPPPPPPPTSCAASTSPPPPATCDALRATLAPDVEWTEMAGFPLAGTYRTPTASPPT